MRTLISSRLPSLLAAAALLVSACDGRVYTKDGVTDGDTFYLAEIAYADPDPVLQAWVAYSLDLSTCQLQIGGDNPARNSSFECELGARRVLLDDWSDRKLKDPLIEDDYLDELLRVRGVDFLSEYVADHFRRGHWELPSGLDTRGYRQWRKAELSHHRAERRLIGSWNFRDPDRLLPVPGE